MSAVPASIASKSSKVAALAELFGLDIHVASNVAESHRLRVAGEAQSYWSSKAMADASRLLGAKFEAFDAAVKELMETRLG